jgi:hypothetical protein
MISWFSIDIFNQGCKIYILTLRRSMWKKMKLQHKYIKVLFVLLERTISDDFFKGKIHMNPSKDPPFDEFNEVFK